MKNYIIGISGKRNSGKDTIASMINYIFAVGIGKANYSDWIIKKTSIDNTNADRVIHFADSLKDVLSIIYNIPREYFNNRMYKDEMWYNIRSNTFNSVNANYSPDTTLFINAKDLDKCCSIAKYITDNPHKQVYIKLRTIMQYFGTDLCRNKLADDIWIRNTMTKVADTALSRHVCIIPDVRFSNEAKAIKINKDYLYGGLIMVNRDSCDNNEHSSEIIDFNYDFVINNNNSKLMLFYNVLNICQTIINNK